MYTYTCMYTYRCIHLQIIYIADPHTHTSKYICICIYVHTRKYSHNSFAHKAHCNTLHYTATHCNTLQHTAPHCKTFSECIHARVYVYIHNY